MRNTELVTAQSPDLVVIAFGMNESSSTDSYKNNIVSIINSVTQPNAAAEFLLVSAFTPNTTAKTFQNIVDIRDIVRLKKILLGIVKASEICVVK